VLSNNLDELIIWQIITQIVEEAPRYQIEADRLIERLVYGVGTRLVTSWGDPALGGVYKLVAVCDNGDWLPALKVSESPDKTPNPGYKNVWRIYDKRGSATADLIGLADETPAEVNRLLLRHPINESKYRVLEKEEISEVEPLLVEVLKDGRRLLEKESLEDMRLRRREDVSRLDPGVRRIMNPHIYHVSLTQRLYDLKQELVSTALENGNEQD
jgi:nicotinate phosphoribosyltransferase